jgi:outer membrane protein assembly factor BamB
MTYVSGTGKVYFNSRFNVVCADAFNGTQYWSTYEGREIFTTSAYADGKLYQISDARLLYCLDANTGAKLSWFELVSEAWASPAVWNGKLYVGCLDNKIYCFGDFPAVASSYAEVEPAASPATGQIPSETVAPNANVAPTEAVAPIVSGSSTTSLNNGTTSAGVLSTYQLAGVAALAVAVVAIGLFLVKRKAK